jgi:hypothetical protein
MVRRVECGAGLANHLPLMLSRLRGDLQQKFWRVVPS